MKYFKHLTLLTLVVIVAVAADAAFSIDFRYRLFWTDPNPPGVVQSWVVYATNLTGARQVSTTTTNADLLPLLNGATAGIYTLYTTAISTLGAESLPGDQIQVVWPGGDGRPRGGKGIGVSK